MAFIDDIKQGCIDGWKTNYILPSVSGAQAILESNWGNSVLAKSPNYNLFGIKASDNWTGATVTTTTKEYVNGNYITVNATFRRYNSWKDSIVDHSKFFTNTDWRKENYKAVVGEKNYKKACEALQEAGYATDPKYASSLIRIIEAQKLNLWDAEAQTDKTDVSAVNPQVAEREVVDRYYDMVDVEYDDGNFYTVKGVSTIYSREANDKWSRKGGWINHYLDSDKEKPEEIFADGLAYLKEHSEPKVVYSLTGMALNEFDNSISIGDTVKVTDHYFKPPLYLQADVFAIERDETGSVISLEIGNYKPLPSGIPNQIKDLQTSINDFKTAVNNQFQATITSTSGTTFKNTGDLETTLIVNVTKANVDYTKQVNEFRWYKSEKQGNEFTPDFSWTKSGSSVRITANDIITTEAIFTCECLVDNHIVATVYQNIKDLSVGHYVTDVEPPVEHVKFGDVWSSPTDLINKTWNGTAWEEEVTQTQIKEESKALEQKITDAKLYTKKQISEFDEFFNTETEAIKKSVTDSYNNAVAEANSAVKQADLEYQEKFKKYDKNVTDLNTSITNAETKANDALSSAGVANTASETAKQLANEAKQQAMDAKSSASNAVTQASSAVTQSKNAFETAKEALDNYNNLTIGGRNLLTNTEKEWTTRHVTSGPNGSAYGVYRYDENVTKILRETYGQPLMVSFDVYIQNAVEDKTIFRIYGTNGTPKYIINHYFFRDTPTNKWVRVKAPLTVTLNESNPYHSRIEFYGQDNPNNTLIKVRKLKLETGNVATDWTPAPDDLQVQFQVMDDKIEGKVSQTEYDILEGKVSTQETEISQTKKDITSKASQTDVDTINGRVDTAESNIKQNAKGLTERYTKTAVDDLLSKKASTTYVNTEIETTAEGIKKTIEKVTGLVDGVAVGNGNLIIPNAEIIENANYSMKVFELTEAIKPNTKYTFTLWGKLGADRTQFRIYNYTGNVAFAILNEEIGGAYRATFTTGADGTGSFKITEPRIVLYQFYREGTSVSVVHKAKLEYGEPNDTLSNIKALTTTVKETADQVSTMITDYAKTSDLKGMVTETTLSTKGYQTATQVGQSLSSYIKTTDLNGKLKETTNYQNIEATTNMFTRVIGSTDNAIKKNIARIVLADSAFVTEISNSDLIARIAGARLINDDPLFEKGNDGFYVYNNSGNGTVTFTREIEKSGTQPNGAYRLKIVTNGTATPGAGGIVKLGLTSRNNAEFVIRFTALVPLGKTLMYANNGMGDGYQVKWLTDTKGNGGWKEYAYYYKCGSSGTFSTFGHLYIVEPGNVTWYISKYEAYDLGQSYNTRVNQLADSWAMTLSSGTDVKTAINATTDGLKFTGKLIHLSGESQIDNAVIKNAMIDTMNVNKLSGTEAEFKALFAKSVTAEVITATNIKVDSAFIDKFTATEANVDRFFSKQAVIDHVEAKALKAVNADITNLRSKIITTDVINSFTINVSQLKGDSEKFVSTNLQKSLTRSIIEPDRIRIENEAKTSFVEMNANQELRTRGANGLGAVLANSSLSFTDTNRNTVGYLGSINASGDLGVRISKNKSFKIIRDSDTTGGTPATKYTVKAGDSWRSITNTYLGANVSVYVLADMNNTTPSRYLQPGEQIIVKEAVAGNSSGFETFINMGTSSSGQSRLYFSQYSVFEAGVNLNSDRRLKENVEDTQLNALDIIKPLEFKTFDFKKTKRHVKMGLIAQEAGELQTYDGDRYSIDLELSVMTALKGVQELEQRLAKLEKGVEHGPFT